MENMILIQLGKMFPPEIDSLQDEFKRIKKKYDVLEECNYIIESDGRDYNVIDNTPEVEVSLKVSPLMIGFFIREQFV